jgi:putative DNA primase/helicase
MKMQIAVGTDLGHVDNVVVTWADFRKALTRHKVATAKGGKYFVGGYFNGHERREANMVSRTVLTFDVDAPTMPLDEMELALEMHLGCGLVAYSTYNHTADEPRIRIVIPLSRAVTPAEHGPPG